MEEVNIVRNWVEFLVNPATLDAHIAALKAGLLSHPSATDLLELFLEEAVSDDFDENDAATSTTEATERRAEHVAALHAMCARVVAGYEMNVLDIERGVSTKWQYELVRVLRGVDAKRYELLFHRWVLRAAVRNVPHGVAIGTVRLGGATKVPESEEQRLFAELGNERVQSLHALETAVGASNDARAPAADVLLDVLEAHFVLHGELDERGVALLTKVESLQVDDACSRRLTALRVALDTDWRRRIAALVETERTDELVDLFAVSAVSNRDLPPNALQFALDRLKAASDGDVRERHLLVGVRCAAICWLRACLHPGAGTMHSFIDSTSLRFQSLPEVDAATVIGSVAREATRLADAFGGDAHVLHYAVDELIMDVKPHVPNERTQAIVAALPDEWKERVSVLGATESAVPLTFACLDDAARFGDDALLVLLERTAEARHMLALLRSKAFKEAGAHPYFGARALILVLVRCLQAFVEADGGDSLDTEEDLLLCDWSSTVMCLASKDGDAELFKHLHCGDDALVNEVFALACCAARLRPFDANLLNGRLARHESYAHVVTHVDLLGVVVSRARVTLAAERIDVHGWSCEHVIIGVADADDHSEPMQLTRTLRALVATVANLMRELVNLNTKVTAEKLGSYIDAVCEQLSVDQATYGGDLFFTVLRSLRHARALSHLIGAVAWLYSTLRAPLSSVIMSAEHYQFVRVALHDHVQSAGTAIDVDAYTSLEPSVFGSLEARLGHGAANGGTSTRLAGSSDVLRDALHQCIAYVARRSGDDSFRRLRLVCADLAFADASYDDATRLYLSCLRLHRPFGHDARAHLNDALGGAERVTRLVASLCGAGVLFGGIVLAQYAGARREGVETALRLVRKLVPSKHLDETFVPYLAEPTVIEALVHVCGHYEHTRLVELLLEQMGICDVLTAESARALCLRLQRDFAERHAA